MNKDQLAKLKVYVSSLKDRLSAPTPEKHKLHPETFKQFLRNEIATAESKIEAARLEAVKS